MKHRKNGFWPKMAPLTKKGPTTLAKGSPKNKFTFSGVEAPHGKAQEGRIAGLFNRRATQPCGMDRRIKM